MHWSSMFLDGLMADVRSAEEVRRKLRNVSKRSARSTKNLKSHIEEMEDWLGELALLNQTMLNLLLQKKAFSREELSAAMKKIDLLDGVEDGKVTLKRPEKEKPAPKKKKAPRRRRR